MILLFAMAAAATDLARAPLPVRAFIARRADCDHWGGEEPYDAARRREIERAIRNLRCDALDADERTLRRQYRQRPALLRLIARTRDADGAELTSAAARP